MKRKIALFLAICLSLSLVLTGCSGRKQAEEDAVCVTSTVTRDTKFNAATVALGPSDIEEAGFSLGDSVDIEFGNGYKLKDVPFYNGYYVKNGYPIFIAYPGFPNVSITLNNVGIWEQADLSDNMSVTIRLNSRGKYTAIQESLGQSYSFDRNEYENDEEFVNFRALSGGSLRENVLFRGASPVDNSRGRAPYTDALLEANQIDFIIDLADSDEDVKGYMAEEDFASGYTKALYDEGKIALLSMGSSYQSDAYRNSVASGLKQMLASGATRVYIHCMEGKDRTGFVCMLIEALCGATYDEMLADYMITYKNYYRVTPDITPEKYNAIAELYFNSFVEFLHGTSDINELKAADYSEDATKYLRDGGMSDGEIGELVELVRVVSR